MFLNFVALFACNSLFCLVICSFILVSLFKKGEKIILSVKDDGLGIAEKDIENIFERFYQADASRRTIGTGLGLPMVNII